MDEQGEQDAVAVERPPEVDWRTLNDPVLADAGKHLDRAESYFAEGNDKKAISELRKAWGSCQFNLGGTKAILELAEKIKERADGATVVDASLLRDGLVRQVSALESRPAGAGVRSDPRWRVGIPVATTPFLPGYEILEYIGEVFGVVVRSRGAIPQLGAQLKSIVGGDLGTMTNLLDQSRKDAITKMVTQAEQRGADAIISMRFDADAIADGWTEVCAYGTAVKTRQIGAEGTQD